MTRIIAVVSGKGGVGKTTMVANIGVALAKMGKNVIILDANLTTPSLGLHLGVPLYPITIHDVLKDQKNISDEIARNLFRGLLAGISEEDNSLNFGKLAFLRLEKV